MILCKIFFIKFDFAGRKAFLTAKKVVIYDFFLLRKACSFFNRFFSKNKVDTSLRKKSNFPSTSKIPFKKKMYQVQHKIVL